MYKLFENFRNNIQERVGDKIIKVEAVVVTSKKQDMTVTDYLSRIRGIEGVTIVKAEETLEKQLHNTTRMSLKIDGEYLPEGSTNAILEKVRSQALSIPGVVRFTYTSLPQI
jgi:cell division protein FtsX